MATKSPRGRTLETELFGQSVEFDYSESWIGYSVLSLRLVMAYVFLSAGIEKLLDPGWSASGFLVNAVPDGNPLIGVWTVLAEGWLWVIDPLNVWGQVLIGLALLFGVFVRTAAFFGALMMLMYWLASLHGGFLAGLPVQNGYVVTYHLVYAFLLFGVGAVGAGRILGVDQKLERTDVVRDTPWLRYFLG